jgi:Dolichyl-phosphate-mannose-protein mannosyltransferase
MAAGTQPVEAPASVARVWPALRAGSPALWLAALVIAGLALRTALAWQSIETLVAKVTPDDAYYYLQIAKNIASGEGASLDGAYETNGFHPLWMAVLLPFARLGDEAFLRAALTLGSMLDAAAIVALWWAIAPLARQTIIRVTAVAFYAANTSITFAAVNGLESSLSLLLMILLLGLLFRAKESSSLRFWVAFGCVAGLAVLARTDNALLVLPMFAAAAIVSVVGRRHILAAATAIAVTLPWFIWNLATFDAIAQGSAEAPVLLERELFDPDGTKSTAEYITHAASEVKHAFLVQVPETHFFDRAILGPLVAGLITVTAIASVRSAGARVHLRWWLPLLAAPTLGFCALVVAHAGYRWFVQSWYFLFAVPLAACYLALALETISNWLSEERVADQRSWIAPVAVAAVLVVVLTSQVVESADRWSPGQYYWQQDMLAGALWLESESPSDARVASMNAGIVAYFSDRTATNLDGIVNDEALEAVREKELLAFADGVAPAYVADYDLYLLMAYRSFWGGDIHARLDPVIEFNRAVERLPFRVYQYDIEHSEDASPVDTP